MNPRKEKLKTNAAGEYIFWAYTYRNTHTGQYYCGVTVNRSNRRSLWKNTKYKYAGKKVNDARLQYNDWDNDWEYKETQMSSPTYESLLTEMEQVEAYLIAYYGSFTNGYNTRPAGSGRGSRSRVLVIEADGKQSVYDSCESVAAAFSMSPGIVYHYAYRTPSHKNRKGMSFLPIDDTATMSALPPTFTTTYSI